MLSHDDRRRLEAIERQLESDDPRLARRFSGWAPSPLSRWVALGAMLLVLLGSLGLLAGILLLSPAVALVSLMALVGGLGLLRRTRRARG